MLRHGGVRAESDGCRRCKLGCVLKGSGRDGLGGNDDDKEGGNGEVGSTRIGRLCEGEPGLVVNLEDLLDGVDVGRRPQIQAQVVLAGRAHDLLQSTKQDALKNPLQEHRHLTILVP